MTTLVCNASDIHKINQTKEYTATSTFLLEELLTNANLTPCASKLWQILFNKARFKEDLDIKVSYSELACTLHKTPRTIYRYITELVRNNYIVIKNNFFKNGGQDINTIYVRFPQSMAQEALKKKDRIKKFTKDQTQTISLIEDKKRINSLEEISSLIVNQNSCDGDEPLTSTKNNDPSTLYSSIDTTDKIVREEGDNFVIPNININLYSNNNKIPNVVFPDFKNDLNETTSEIHTQIKKQEELIAKLANQQQKAEKSWLTEKDKAEVFKKLQLFGQVNSEYIQATNQLKILMKKFSLAKNNRAKKSALQTDINLIFKQEGVRHLSSFTFERLIKALEKKGFQGAEKTKLVNEIIFEVRFGSLVNNNSTGEALSVEHAINIALLLVRENRWGTPTSLNEIDKCTVNNKVN